MTSNNTPKRADSRPMRSWPLYLLAAPAGVAVWSGWVGLGELTGFGVVHPLPGIAPNFEINTAITLPIGVEAYAAYALGVWLSHRRLSTQTRQFAGWSALGAFLFGGLGQVAYHLLEAAGAKHAPTWVTTIVACFPVLVLGLGTTLAHLVHRDARAMKPEPDEVPVLVPNGVASQVQQDLVPNLLPDICTGSIRNQRNLNQRLTEPRNPVDAEPAPEPEPTAGEQRPQRTARQPKPRTKAPTASLTDRAERKTVEVQQILSLMEELGFDAVTLTEVRNRWNHLSKTTAYHRLTEARNQWNQRAS